MKFNLIPADLDEQVYGVPPEFIQAGEEGLLLCDPILLADVFNEGDCEIAKYIAKNGHVINSQGYGDAYFNGDDIFTCAEDEIDGKFEAACSEIASDSLCILAMPYVSKMYPREIMEKLRESERGFHYEILKAKPGKYKSFIFVVNEGITENRNLYLKFIR